MVLVLNAGSSSLKCSIFDTSNMPQRRASFLVERIGQEHAHVESTIADKVEHEDIHVASHGVALQWVIKKAVSKGIDIHKIQHIGHRVVHGGEYFLQPTRVNKAVIEQIRACIPLAPLHNPANVQGIMTAMELFSQVEHTAVFDTSFHQSLSPERYLYALPIALYHQHKIRKYGFHGTSYKYISERCKKVLKLSDIIVCHLGNGASICAIENGASVDTSMGFTPLQGLVMGTRSGDIDPSILFYLLEHGYTQEQLVQLVNKKSGLKGLSEISNDMRDLHKARAQSTKADMAIRVFCRRVAQYIGAYYATMSRCQALVFTAGIGENDGPIRDEICSLLHVPSLRLDPTSNVQKIKQDIQLISTNTSHIPVYVVKTDEEFQIAKEITGMSGADTKEQDTFEAKHK